MGLLIVAAFWKELFGFDTFAARDFGLFSYPTAFFQRQCFWQGQLPFWNPYNCCGLPFLAQFNTLALYPLSILYLLLPLSWGLPFFCLLHVFLGGIGMYFLARRWTNSEAGAALAGLVFAFNGLTLNFLMWPSHIATFAWMPWVIFLTEAAWREGGRKLAPAALAAAMEVLGGGPETILFTWLILAALALTETFSANRPPVVALAQRFFTVGSLALCLAAPQLLPFADFSLHSNRSASYGASDWSMPASGWANFLTPRFQTIEFQGMAMQPNQYWTESYYVGIGVIFLAAIAVWRARSRRVWVIAGFVLAALILAPGDHALVYLWLRKAFPLLGFFRYPIKFVILTSALFPLLAACAISRYETFPRRGTMEVICAAAIVIGVGVILWLARTSPAWPGTQANALSRLGFLAALLAAIWFFAARPGQRHWSALLILLAVWGDLMTAMPWQNPGLNPSVYQPGLGRMEDKSNPPPIPGESRLMISSSSASHLYYYPPPDLKTAYLLDRAMFMADCNLLDNVPKVDGFFSLYLRETDRVLWLLDPARGAELDHLENFLGVSQTVAPGKVYDWSPRTNYLPIVTAGQAPVFADDQTALKAISQTNVDFRSSVYLQRDAQSHITARRETNVQIADVNFSANREMFRVESAAPALVFISQSYYHNWIVRVDDQPTPLWRANYAFQALEVPAGAHFVSIVYQDKMFRIGTFLAAWAGLLCIALLFLPGRRQISPRL